MTLNMMSYLESFKMEKKIVMTKKKNQIMKIDELKNKVELWAIARELHHSKNCKSQTLKTVEEVGELAWAINRNDIPAVVDAIGDVTVTLIILCLQLDLDFEKCLESAWNEIKDREGITVDGNFIKND